MLYSVSCSCRERALFYILTPIKWSSNEQVVGCAPARAGRPRTRILYTPTGMARVESSRCMTAQKVAICLHATFIRHEVIFSKKWNFRTVIIKVNCISNRTGAEQTPPYHFLHEYISGCRNGSQDKVTLTQQKLQYLRTMEHVKQYQCTCCFFLLFFNWIFCIDAIIHYFSFPPTW